mmetsp:Transcript_30488/g.62899  ORF Transcript_30488/g.62899 Transcript_30488/m.62899 type:complete len:286 (-) Transcript_30488:3777-4634(-)
MNWEIAIFVSSDARNTAMFCGTCAGTQPSSPLFTFGDIGNTNNSITIGSWFGAEMAVHWLDGTGIPPTAILRSDRSVPNPAISYVSFEEPLLDTIHKDPVYSTGADVSSFWTFVQVALTPIPLYVKMARPVLFLSIAGARSISVGPGVLGGAMNLKLVEYRSEKMILVTSNGVGWPAMVITTSEGEESATNFVTRIVISSLPSADTTLGSISSICGGGWKYWNVAFPTKNDMSTPSGTTCGEKRINASFGTNPTDCGIFIEKVVLSFPCSMMENCSITTTAPDGM